MRELTNRGHENTRRHKLTVALSTYSILIVLIASLAVATARAADQDQRNATPYFPDRWTWETREPAEAGFNPERLAEAVQFAKDHASTADKDLGKTIAINISAEPFSDLVGPTKTRGEMSGIILSDGYIVAEWGDTDAST